MVGGSAHLSFEDKKTNVIHNVFPVTNNPIYREALDVDHVMMRLCKPFKTIIENCTIPMSQCIEDIANKEIVMAEILKKMVAKTKRAMEIVNNATQPDFLGGFSHDDCIVFGGDVAGASLQSPRWGHIVATLVVIYFKL